MTTVQACFVNSRAVTGLGTAALVENVHCVGDSQVLTVNTISTIKARRHVRAEGLTFAYDNEASGPFVEGEILTFTAPAGTAELIKLTDAGTTGTLVIGPMLSGDIPVDDSTIAGASATADVNGTTAAALDHGDTSTSSEYLILRIANAQSTGIYVAVGTTPVVTATTATSATSAKKLIPGNHVAHFGGIKYGDKVIYTDV